MKKHMKRILSLALALSMVAALGINAAASDALGEDLTEQEVLVAGVAARVRFSGLIRACLRKL